MSTPPISERGVPAGVREEIRRHLEHEWQRVMLDLFFTGEAFTSGGRRIVLNPPRQSGGIPDEILGLAALISDGKLIVANYRDDAPPAWLAGALEAEAET